MPDDKSKKKDQKPPEDIFEVYDIDEAKTEEAPDAPQEEEIIELEEATEAHAEKAAIEQSVEDEMADIFGEEILPQEEAPAIADDFDLSIFKESGAPAQEVATLGEADLSAVSQDAPTSTAGFGPSIGAIPSRVEAAAIGKGPSTVPMTIAVVVAFTALLVAGMVIIFMFLVK